MNLNNKTKSIYYFGKLCIIDYNPTITKVMKGKKGQKITKKAIQKDIDIAIEKRKNKQQKSVICRPINMKEKLC